MGGLILLRDYFYFEIQHLICMKHHAFLKYMVVFLTQVALHDEWRTVVITVF